MYSVHNIFLNQKYYQYFYKQVGFVKMIPHLLISTKLYICVTLQESELTRLQTRIAVHERTASIKQLIEHHWFDNQGLDFAKQSTCRKLRRSTSTSDLNIKDNKNVLSQNQTVTLHSSVSSEMSKYISDASPKSLNESSFDPLTYNVEEEVTCNSNDFQTLSGMLKYINKEIKDSENSSL